MYLKLDKALIANQIIISANPTQIKGFYVNISVMHRLSPTGINKTYVEFDVAVDNAI